MPLSVGVTLPNVTVTGGSVGTSLGSAATPGASTPATPATPAVVTDATTKAAWAIQNAETIYVNERLSNGPSAWVAYTVIYVFKDGNAVLVREPDRVTYTGPLAVADNLRRAGETYADPT